MKEMFMLGLLIGLFLGAVFGVVIYAMIRAVRKEDRRKKEDMWQTKKRAAAGSRLKMPCKCVMFCDRREYGEAVHRRRSTMPLLLLRGTEQGLL